MKLLSFSCVDEDHFISSMFQFWFKSQMKHHIYKKILEAKYNEIKTGLRVEPCGMPHGKLLLLVNNICLLLSTKLLSLNKFSTNSRTNLLISI